MLAEDYARVDPGVWQSAGRAINQSERLRLRYQRFDGATRDYLLEPYHLVACGCRTPGCWLPANCESGYGSGCVRDWLAVNDPSWPAWAGAGVSRSSLLILTPRLVLNREHTTLSVGGVGAGKRR